DEDREDIIANMQKEGAGAINVGIDAVTSSESIALTKEYDHIWASVGCHPTEISGNFDIDLYHGMIQKDPESVVAVGECGLDYFRSANRDDANQKLQKKAFEAQMELAITEDLPLILHLRPQEGSMDAYKEGLEILEYYSRQAGDKLRGTAHFFVGDEDIAARFLDIGFYISATGVVTFDERLQDVFADLPADHLLVETDAPFAAPEPYRGRRNSPLYVPDIIGSLAALKGTTATELTPKLVSNTQRLFSL
ncbi:MAG: TatD family hydrolase, partial [Actinobacteria bacterium]|nr:TatD family hydrolase [Actinomycetota bacterium]